MEAHKSKRFKKENGLKETKGEPWEDNFRLPLSVHPDHYDLYIYPDLTTKLFSGTVTIHVTSHEARDYFLLHTKWLNISHTKLEKVEENKKQVFLRDFFIKRFLKM